MGIDWTLPVKLAGECPPCPDCGAPWCEECEEHYADCAHPGPTMEPPSTPEPPPPWRADEEGLS